MIPENENFEKTLREALRREPPPRDFAAKVLAKTSGATTATHGSPTLVRMPARQWFRRPVTLALAAAVASLAIVPAVVLDYRHREEMKARQARRDLLTALAITREQLRQAQAKVLRNVRFVQ